MQRLGVIDIFLILKCSLLNVCVRVCVCVTVSTQWTYVKSIDLANELVYLDAYGHIYELNTLVVHEVAQYV